MQPQFLVVSDPPHGDVDLGSVAEALGLDVEHARLKVGFPAPEILAASDDGRARELATALDRTGLRVVLIDGHDLADVPWPAVATSLHFGPAGLVAALDGETVELAYDRPFLGFTCLPPSEVVRAPALGVDGRGPEVADTLEWTPHLDVYFGTSGSVRRLTVARDVDEIVAECEERFERLDLDRRLDAIRPRQRFVAGEADFDMDLRKAFSFGTLLLRQVLESISTDLRDIPQYEFASRLSYVMRREKPTA